MSVKRHTTYNIAGAVVPLLGMFLTLPIYLRTIGEERYGILAILWSLLGYFGLFDLGLGQAVTNRIAAFRNRTELEREQVFWTALLMNFVLGCAGAVVLWAAGSVLFSHFIDVPTVLSSEVHEALPLMVLAFPLLLASSVMSGALMGREEFLAQNGVRIGEGVLVQIAPLVVALVIDPALPALVITVLAVRVMSGVSLFGLCVLHLPLGLKPKFERSHLRPLFGYGGWVTVTSVVGPLLSTLDRVVIGGVAGVKAVTYYTVPFHLASRLSIVPGSLASALFPRFSSSNDAERDALLTTGIRSLVVIVTPLIVGGLLIMEPFLAWWMSEEFAARAAPIGEILTIGLWANCLAYLPYTHIQGRGRPDLTAKIHLAELLPYVAVLWAALAWKGVVGAALAWSLRVWADAALMFWGSRFRDFQLLLGGGAMLIAGTITVLATSGTTWHGILVRSAVIVVSILWAWRAAPPLLKSWSYGIVARFPRSEAAQV